MDSFQVKFKCLPDPASPGGIVLTYHRVGELTHSSNAIAVHFRDTSELESAFTSAGIYLRRYLQADPESGASTDPEQNYEVTVESLRKIGFNLG